MVSASPGQDSDVSLYSGVFKRTLQTSLEAVEQASAHCLPVTQNVWRQREPAEPRAVASKRLLHNAKLSTKFAIRLCRRHREVCELRREHAPTEG